jgi:pimeloyl-ACP methyl ester carboxylesterase
VNGIDIEYSTTGNPSDPALLLVMGLGAQLTAWPDGFVDLLAGHGYFVIRYDNRDTGLSTKFEGEADLAALLGGDTSSASYFIEDMADDGVALLTHLGIDRAHVVGASMGGMIIQAMVIHHPDRFISACSVMSTTGDRSVGQPSPEAMTALLRPRASTREEAIDGAVEASKIIGSPGYPADETTLRQRAAESYDRSFCPEGFGRQLAAILASPDRTEGLGQVKMPFLVIHGEADPLVTPSGGAATAAAVPDSTYLTIPGMAHDLPDALWVTISDAVVTNASLAGN